jgi:hypothetical protein
VKRDIESSCGALLGCDRPGPWQELVEAIIRPEIDEADEDIGEIGLGLDSVELDKVDGVRLELRGPARMIRKRGRLFVTGQGLIVMCRNLREALELMATARQPETDLAVSRAVP